MVFEETLHGARFSLVSGQGRSLKLPICQLWTGCRGQCGGWGWVSPQPGMGDRTVPWNPESSISQQSHSRGVHEEHGGQGWHHHITILNILLEKTALGVPDGCLYSVLYISVVPYTGPRAGVQRAGNPVGCEGKAETTSYPCSWTGILSWTTKPLHQEPRSDQSKEGRGCPGKGMARLGLAGVSWQQGWGWDFWGPLPNVLFPIWVSPLPKAISTPFNFPRAWWEREKRAVKGFLPLPFQSVSPWGPQQGFGSHRNV